MIEYEWKCVHTGNGWETWHSERSGDLADLLRWHNPTEETGEITIRAKESPKPKKHGIRILCDCGEYHTLSWDNGDQMLIFEKA